MLREIRWSNRAIKEWIEILEYWNDRNKSNTYSLKLDYLFKVSFKVIAQSPEIGKATDSPSVRIKIVLDYLIYYRITPTHIEILTVWDSRRNPKKFKI